MRSVSVPPGLALPDRPASPLARLRCARRGRLWPPLVTVIVATGAIGAAAETIRGDLFRNERYRIQLTKPPGWHFVPAEAASSRARQALPEAARKGRGAGASLLVAASEAPPGSPARYPGRVTVAVEDLKGRPGMETLELYAQGNLRTLANLLEEFRLEGTTEQVKVGTVAGLRVEYSGTVRRSEGPVTIRGIALHFLRGKTGYAITAVTRAEEFASRRATLEQVLASVQFLP